MARFFVGRAERWEWEVGIDSGMFSDILREVGLIEVVVVGVVLCLCDVAICLFSGDQVFVGLRTASERRRVCDVIKVKASEK